MKHTVTKHGERVSLDGITLEPFQRFYLESDAVEYRNTKKSGPHVVWYKKGTDYSHHIYLPYDGEYEIGPYFDYHEKLKNFQELKAKNDSKLLRIALRRWGVELANLKEIPNGDQVKDLTINSIQNTNGWIETGQNFKIKFFKMCHLDGSEKVHLEKILVWPNFNLDQIEKVLEKTLS